MTAREHLLGKTNNVISILSLGALVESLPVDAIAASLVKDTAQLNSCYNYAVRIGVRSGFSNLSARQSSMSRATCSTFFKS